MQRVLKWIGIVIGGLAGLIVVLVGVSYFMVEARLNKTYDIPPEAVTIPAAVSSAERHWPLVLISICEACHGPALAGQVMSDDPLTGRLVASNLTSGKGGVGSEFSDADWVRALRHGVGPDGKTLLVMPSSEWNNLSDADLGEIIAYVKSVPPVDSELPDTSIRPVGWVMLAVGLIPPEVISAEVIDHTAPRPPAPTRGVTAEYGKYLSFVCTTCHFKDFSGGPDAGQGMNITPGGDVGKWTEEDFIRTLRTGVAPDGEKLDPELMPWREISQMSDDELKAIWLYLQSVSAVETEHR